MKAFSQRGYDLSIITDQETWVAPRTKFAQVYNIPQLCRKNFIKRFLPNTLKIVSILKKVDPDLVHLHVQHYYSVAVFLSRCPYMLTSWGIEILSLPNSSLFIKSIARMTASKAKRITVDANGLKRIWMSMGISENKIEVIPFGVDLRIFNPNIDKSDVRRRLDIEEKDTLIISTRPFYNDHYNVDCLIHAIPLVLKEQQNVKFIIKGAGPLKNYLQSLARKLGVWKYVRFVGLVPHSEVAEYLASADIYVSTSFIDSTSVSLLEAMACGLAPITTDIPGNREWVKNGVNGFLFPPRSPSKLAEKIIQLVENEDKRKRFGEKCLHIVKQRASWESCVNKMETIYQSLF